MSRHYDHDHRVPFEETNLVGNVYFAHYTRWQGHCREAFLHDVAPTTVAALQSGEVALVTVESGVRHVAECFAGDLVTIRMSLARVGPGRAEMSFDYLRAGELVASGHQVIACMVKDQAHGALTPAVFPPDLAQALAGYS